MSPISETIFFSEKKYGFLINRCHKTTAAVEEFEESGDGVFLPLFLY